MLSEILNALAAVATVGGFVIDVATRLRGWLEGRNAHKRMEREGVIEAPENEQRPE